MTLESIKDFVRGYAPPPTSAYDFNEGFMSALRRFHNHMTTHRHNLGLTERDIVIFCEVWGNSIWESHIYRKQRLEREEEMRLYSVWPYIPPYGNN